MSMLLLTQPAPNLNAQNHLILLTQQSAKSKSVCMLPKKSAFQVSYLMHNLHAAKDYIYLCGYPHDPLADGHPQS